MKSKCCCADSNKWWDWTVWLSVRLCSFSCALPVCAIVALLRFKGWIQSSWARSSWKSQDTSVHCYWFCTELKCSCGYGLSVCSLSHFYACVKIKKIRPNTNWSWTLKYWLLLVEPGHAVLSHYLWAVSDTAPLPLSLEGHLSGKAELNQLHLIPDGATVACWHSGH